MGERRRFWRLLPEPVWWVLGGAIVLVLLVMTPTAKQWHATSGLPQEHATVTHVTRVDGSCGKGVDKRDVDWHSSQPPRGLPADFSEVGSCRVVKPGQSFRIVRVVDPHESPVKAQVVVEPPRSFGNVLAAGSVGAVGGALCGLLVFGLGRFQRMLVRRRLRRRAESARG